MTFRGRLMFGASWLACRLPERPLFRVAGLAGDLWYRLAPGRAAQARRNLRRVCTALAASGRGSASRPRRRDRPASPSNASSAPPSGTPSGTTSRSPATRGSPASSSTSGSLMDTPDLIAEAVVPGKAVLFVGLHFGSVELAVVYLAFQVGETVTPMETVDDPGLQAYFERTRGVNGVRLVGLKEARRTLTEALRNGIPVGLVGDRDLTGGGIPIPLFGAPAILPMGPAMLAVESGVPVYAMTVRRAGGGRFRGKLIPIDVPARRHAPGACDGDDDAAWRPPSRSSSPTRPTSGGRSSSRSGRTSRRPATRRWGPPHDRAPGRPRSRRPPHPYRGQRRDRDRRGDPRPRRAADRPGRHRDHRPRADRCRAGRAGDGHRPRAARRGRRRRRGDDARRPPARALRRPADPAVSLAALDDHGGPRRGRAGHPGPSARPVSAVRPGLDAPPAARRPGPGRPIPTGSRRSTRRASGSRGIAGSSASPTSTASPGSATATPTRSRRSRPAGRPSPAGRRTTSGARSKTGPPITAGRSTRPSGQFGTFGQQLRKRSRDLRDEVAGRVRRDGTGRDHGYPGGRLRPPRYEVGGPAATDEPAEIGQAGRR